MTKGVVYTAITGSKDELREPGHVMPGVRYVCFTDDPALASDVWEIRLLERTDRDPTRVAKRPKILPHHYLAAFDWSLWIDANFDIVEDLRPVVEENLARASFSAFRHQERGCAYDEAAACVNHKKDCPKTLLAQVRKYREMGMPERLPVSENGFLLRRHNDPSLIAAMELWWSEIARHSRRDQISLPFVQWARPFDFRSLFDGTVSIHDFASVRGRRHRREASFPCWARAPLPASFFTIPRCWACTGERPPLRGWANLGRQNHPSAARARAKTQ